MRQKTYLWYNSLSKLERHKPLGDQAMNFSINVSKTTIQILRVVALIASFFAFAAMVYFGLIIGLDIPKWRMNGQTSTMILYIIGFSISLAVGIVSLHVSERTKVILNSESALESEDEI